MLLPEIIRRMYAVRTGGGIRRTGKSIYLVLHPFVCKKLKGVYTKGKSSYGFVGASKILFSVFPEICFDNLMIEMREGWPKNK
jgi:hypothetical protein